MYSYLPVLDMLIFSRKTLRAGHVTFDNYLNFFQLLLWLDEIALAEMLSKYNMENVRLFFQTERYNAPYFLLR